MVDEEENPNESAPEGKPRRIRCRAWLMRQWTRYRQGLLEMAARFVAAQVLSEGWDWLMNWL